ncbi:hypothetical protein [Oligoflexus tunisiensis]|uniref:hypothetical protein n=1 Tax=Oligoflexus tunisiensis TaxID=708132 RepID=UPI00114CC121|nr:hypothetical protein [Oligoflexus tunisiensis]
MKIQCLGILILAALSCGKNSDNNKDENTTAPLPGADQTSLEGYSLSPNRAFAAKIVWNNAPVAGSFDNSAEVYFLDPKGEPVSTSQLTRFHLYMASMGHPSIKENEMTFTQVDPGHWTVGRIYFSMGGSSGSWVVDLEAEVNGQADQVRVSIDHAVE